MENFTSAVKILRGNSPGPSNGSISHWLSRLKTHAQKMRFFPHLPAIPAGIVLAFFWKMLLALGNDILSSHSKTTGLLGCAPAVYTVLGVCVMRSHSIWGCAAPWPLAVCNIAKVREGRRVGWRASFGAAARRRREKAKLFLSRLRALRESICVSAEASGAARVNFGLAPGMNSSSYDTRKQVRGQPATAFACTSKCKTCFTSWHYIYITMWSNVVEIILRVLFIYAFYLDILFFQIFTDKNITLIYWNKEIILLSCMECA